MAYRDIILSKTFEYIKEKKLSASGRGAIVMIDCPFCSTQKSAQFIRQTGKIRCIKCQKTFTLIDLVKHVENKKEQSEEQILTYLRDLLKLDVQTTQDADNLEKILKTYSDRGWALVPCAKASNIGHVGEKVSTGKEVIQSEWQKKENRNPSEWSQWVYSSLNLGVRTGQVSNLTIIDFDLLSKEEKAELVKETTNDKRKAEIVAKKAIPSEIKAIIGDTLIQESHGGMHLMYSYCSELRKTGFNYNGVHIDIENDLGQVVIYPSNKIGVEEEFVDEKGDTKKRIVGYAGRKFINDKPIIPIPPEFLKWLQEHIKPINKTDDKIQDSNIILDVPNDIKIKDIQGNRNNTLISLGGVLRKGLNVKDTGFTLEVINKQLFENPLPNSEVKHIKDNLANYKGYDDTELANEILSYLKDTDTASKGEIEAACFGGRTTSENKKRLDRTLMNLVREEKIMKKNSRDYKFLRDMEWNDKICNVGNRLNFKVPYFENYARFFYGDNVLIGGITKAGKSHICMNIVKLLVQQGLKPYYIFNEPGGRYAQISLQLGLKDGDFYSCFCSNPNDIIMKQNSIYLYDWYRPNDFTKTAQDFDGMAQKLHRTQSFMITFTQLRDGSAKLGNQSEWFAKDQIRQFVALSAKYKYKDHTGIDTYFDVDDIRESKTGHKKFQIPCKYNRETKEVMMVEELEKEVVNLIIEQEKPKTPEDIEFEP